MNNSLEKPSLIHQSDLNGENYFQSLLEAAQSKNLLQSDTMQRIQYECLGLLAYKCERYNAGDSSSIPVDKAQDIMESIFFTIGFWLKTYSNPDDAITMLQNTPIKELYQNGRKRIDTTTAATKNVYKRLLQQLLPLNNAYYGSTIKGEISKFFKGYYPDFAAHEQPVLLAYPLLMPLPALAGIEQIKAYVEAAYYENQFCSYFSVASIHHLLSNYAKDYPVQLMNICEPVLMAALGSIILEEKSIELSSLKTGENTLFHFFKSQPNEEVLAVMQKAAGVLKEQYHFTKGLAQYLHCSLPAMVEKIKTGGAH